MSEYAKSKNYDAAYKPFMEIRKRNPNYSRAIYVYGESILNHKIDNSNGAEKVAYINDLVKLWEERQAHYASKTPQGEFGAKSCQLLYDTRDVLNKTDEVLYSCFDTVFNADSETF